MCSLLRVCVTERKLFFSLSFLCFSLRLKTLLRALQSTPKMANSNLPRRIIKVRAHSLVKIPVSISLIHLFRQRKTLRNSKTRSRFSGLLDSRVSRGPWPWLNEELRIQFWVDLKIVPFSPYVAQFQWWWPKKFRKILKC